MKADVQKIKNPDKEITDVVKAVLPEAVDTVAKKVLVNGRLNHRQQSYTTAYKLEACEDILSGKIVHEFA